jgi:bifunctional non-homologous end joining protein LigD
MAPRDTKKKLAPYKAKRDFSKTGEPSGERAVAPSKRLRFVVQKHAATRLHYDFRLELDGVFKSWAVTRGPSLDPRDKRLAVEVEDHPLDYGDFEGTIPKGQYGGGTVMLWDRGYWQIEGELSPQEALRKGDFKFRLDGKKLHGSWALVRMKRREKERRDNWLLIKHRDEHAVDGHGEKILEDDASVASGRTLAQIAAGKGRAPKPFMLKKAMTRDAVWNSDNVNREHAPDPRPSSKPARTGAAKPLNHLPEFIPPQLCKISDTPPRAAGWGHEVKLDGYRIQMRVEDGVVALRTRKGLDWTEKFKAVARGGEKLADCIIDGEICAIDKEGAPDFPALQAAIAEGKTDKLVYFAFDLLCADGEDLRDLALAERKARLKKLLAKAGANIRYVEHIEDDGKAVLEAARKMGLEGIVSKRLDAPYRSTRGDAWLKIKVRGGQEVVIGGWAEEGARFRSLLVGAYKGGRLQYLGRVGTGFDARTAAQVHAKLKAVAAGDSPFSGPAAPKKIDEIRWAKPALVAEVEFAGWTGDGLMRQAAFKALRDDKPPSEVVVERVTPTPSATPDIILSPQSAKDPRVLGIAISHADKTLWPAAGDDKAVTKLDLARYYEAVGDHLLDYIKGRPCSIIRAPDGITAQQFFQRHEMGGMSKAITLVKVRGDKRPYVQFDALEAIIAAAQIAAVEFHPTNCEPGDPETPGRLVFDLDPAPDVAFDRVVDAAREMKERLEDIGLAAFCKTTGGKGLHVVTHFAKANAKLEWPEAKEFAHEICKRMAVDSPAKYLTTMAKKDRSGRIFLDYLRNDRLSTAVALLSPRARQGAPVSMPLTWAQVREGLDPSRYTIHTAPALLKKSKPWADYARGAKPFTAAAKRLAAA